MIRVGTDCSGIEAPLMALRRLRVRHEHLFSSDIDKDCRDVILMNYKPKTLYDDITRRSHKRLPRLDLYVAGFPCQAFTNLRQDSRGFRDPRGTIFFECLETIRATRPGVFVFENVRGLVSHNGGDTFRVILQCLEELGSYRVYHRILNTKDFGIPQNRPRVYIVGIHKRLDPSRAFRFPDPVPLRRTVTDIMDKDLPSEEHRLTPNMAAVIRNRLGRVADRKPGANYIINVGASENGFGSAMRDVSPCLMANGHRFFSTRFRRFLTGREYLRLQDFPDSFRAHPNEKTTKKQAGNSMSVCVLCHLFKKLLPFLRS